VIQTIYLGGYNMPDLQPGWQETLDAGVRLAVQQSGREAGREQAAQWWAGVRNITGEQAAGDVSESLMRLGADDQFELAQLRELVMRLVPVVNGNGESSPAVSAGIGQAMVDEFQRREARRQLDAREYAQAAGERRLMPFAELEQEPKPRTLLDGMLTCGGFYGLAGPPEAGKSLMLRDWLCHLAASGTPCLYAVSEGQFDLVERFAAHPLYTAARGSLTFFDGPLSMASLDDVAWLAERLDGRFGLVALDMAYGFGVPDDDGTRGVAPFISGCKRLAAITGACVIVTGHPGHNGERRFRGSSMWRGAFDGEFHMASGELTCEKHKYSDRRRFRWSYAIDYPRLRLLGLTGQMDRDMQRAAAIAADFSSYPGDSDSQRARRLAPVLGLSVDWARKEVSGYRKAQAS
jgi:AAA domain